MRQPKLLLSIVIIIASVVLCHQLISHSISNQQNKNDSAELNHVKYGLFSVNEWKRQIGIILAEEINKLNLSGANEQELRRHIEVQLKTLIDEVDKKIREENAGSAKGWVKQTFINLFVSLEDIKKGVPEYADAVIREIEKSKTKRQIKIMLNKQLEHYFAQTYDIQITPQLNRILFRTKVKDITSVRAHLNEAISVTQDLVINSQFGQLSSADQELVILTTNGTSLQPGYYLFLTYTLLAIFLSGFPTRSPQVAECEKQ